MTDVLSPTNIAQERFDNLLRVLRDVHQKKLRFKMDVWAEKLFLRPRTCCVIGWVTYDPWFNERGFILHFTRFTWTVQGIPSYNPSRLAGQGWYGWDAVKQFFMTSHDNEGRLFDYTAYEPSATLPDVIARVEWYYDLRFVQGKSELEISNIIKI